ncbi:sugar ABC transporter permease [Candidatus Caldarchaeum subterraneum]|uniref:Sugar ABC transporter permease n=1 Tax=Caldiarchaeum subterraneum TaxID=311458 RepID=E6N5J6_CALS0|nr:sugar ABC transporter permease [Candidatus Caldarchaeum subterraneum]BAJ50389.1 sugar ABC transporter permease [Candidatus Caldarchaeum subterraneum]
MLSHTKLKRERLVTISGIRGVQISIYSTIASFIVFSIVLSVEGADPLTAYQNMFSFALDPQLGLPLTIHRSMLILFSTLAFIVPLRAGFWNIGMEGQFYLGTIGAFFVAYSLPDYPPEVLIPLMILSGMVFGALYGALAGILRGKFNVNEVVVTLMLNNIAFWMVYLLTVGGPWAGTAESTSRPLPKNAQAPFILGTPFTTFLAIAFAFILYFFLSKTVAGFKIRILGHSPTAAKFVGIDEFKTAVLVMSLGGALAGVAGYHMWAGDPAYLRIPRPDAYKAVGDLTYWGIIIGLVCLLNPIPAMPASFFIGSIIVGSTVLVRRFRLPFGLDFLFLGIISIIFATFQFFLYYRIKVKGK